MREFVVGEEDFRLKMIEKVPEPESGECFLLCQEGAGIDVSMIISRGVKYSATAVRHKHYNKKIIFALQKKDFRQDYHIVMADYDFYFQVDVDISYEIQDVKKYYFGNIMEEDTIRNIAKKCVNRQNRKWRLMEGWELQGELESDIEKEVQQFEGVRFQVKVEVQLDEGAQAILASDQKRVMAIHASGNDKDVQIAANKHRAAIAESERRLKQQQIAEIGMLMKGFGILGPVVNEYIEGKLNGVEFYNYIVKAKTDDMNMLNMAVTNDLLTNDEIMARVRDILTNQRYMNVEVQQLSGMDRSKLEIHSEYENAECNMQECDTKEYGAKECGTKEYDTENEKADVPAEGDFL